MVETFIPGMSPETLAARASDSLRASTTLLRESRIE
jgi:hypothetical protein